MKKTDIAMIILIATVSVLVAFFTTNAIFGGQANEAVNVDTIEEIGGSVSDPDPVIFNSNNINPAVEVQITPGNQ
jgi:ABC-type cobalt transport system substrate-binding protein